MAFLVAACYKSTDRKTIERIDVTANANILQQVVRHPAFATPVRSRTNPIVRAVRATP
jgi:hypothetical protein